MHWLSFDLRYENGTYILVDTIIETMRENVHIYNNIKIIMWVCPLSHVTTEKSQKTPVWGWQGLKNKNISNISVKSVQICGEPLTAFLSHKHTQRS